MDLKSDFAHETRRFALHEAGLRGLARPTRCRKRCIFKGIGIGAQGQSGLARDDSAFERLVLKRGPGQLKANIRTWDMLHGGRGNRKVARSSGDNNGQKQFAVGVPAWT